MRLLNVKWIEEKKTEDTDQDIGEKKSGEAKTGSEEINNNNNNNCSSTEGY